MKHLHYCIGIVLFICSAGSISAQINVDSLPKDPLDSIWTYPALARNHNLSFLLQEDSCYDFHVNDIISLPSGYIILASTKVGTFNVLAYIVSPKKHPGLKIVKKRIRKGKTYSLHLRRYFLLPARVGIEYGDAVDIMMGNRTMSVNESGWYSYLFTSFDIEGLYQIKNKEVVSRKQNFQEEETNLKNTVLPFLEYISYGKQPHGIFDIVDTSQTRRSLNRYGTYWWGRNPMDFDFPNKKHEWRIDHAVKKYDWRNKEGYGKRKSLNPKIYDEIFWGMLKERYKLPVDSQYMDRDSLRSSIRLKLLYYSEPEIYTVQVIWKLPDVKKTFVAIINIQQEKSGYKIIGFNKPYLGYRLYLKEKNERFVPCN